MTFGKFSACANDDLTNAMPEFLCAFRDPKRPEEHMTQLTSLWNSFAFRKMTLYPLPDLCLPLPLPLLCSPASQPHLLPPPTPTHTRPPASHSLDIPTQASLSHTSPLLPAPQPHLPPPPPPQPHPLLPSTGTPFKSAQIISDATCKRLARLLINALIERRSACHHYSPKGN